MKLYSCDAVADLISRYYAAGGDVLEVKPGTLGYGLTICTGEGLRTFVIEEVYVNSSSSGHKVRGYNSTPVKYKKMIEEYWKEYEERFENEEE